MLTKLKSYALYLLSRREYSLAELKQKLLAKKYPDAGADRLLEVDQLLKDLVVQNLQSDERFVENLVRTRVNRGYGPLRISDELARHEINPELIEKYLRRDEDEWILLAEKIRVKKFGNKKSLPVLQLIKQKKYLQYKGFDYSTISKVI